MIEAAGSELAAGAVWHGTSGSAPIGDAAPGAGRTELAAGPTLPGTNGPEAAAGPATPGACGSEPTGQPGTSGACGSQLATPAPAGAGRPGGDDGGVSEIRPGQPRWLDDAEAATWINLVRVLMLLPAALDRQLREEAGIPHPYYQILATLSGRSNHAMRMTDLSRQVGTTASRLSHAVASLEQRGWVRRHACPTDKRGQVARLTDAGLATLTAAAPGHVEEVRRLVFDHLTPDEVVQLGALMAKLVPAGDGPPAE